MQLQPATKADIPDLAQVHIEGWRSSYEGLVPADFLGNLDAETYRRNWAEWLDNADFFALLARGGDGRAAGFISYGRLRTPVPGMSPVRPLYTAEIYALYILPQYWRQRLGRRLIAGAADDLAARRHKSLCLWVMEGNKRAVAFYKALGGQRVGSKKAEIGGRVLNEIAFGWRDTTILRMPPS